MLNPNFKYLNFKFGQIYHFYQRIFLNPITKVTFSLPSAKHQNQLPYKICWWKYSNTPSIYSSKIRFDLSVFCIKDYFINSSLTFSTTNIFGSVILWLSPPYILRLPQFFSKHGADNNKLPFISSGPHFPNWKL